MSRDEWFAAITQGAVCPPGTEWTSSDETDEGKIVKALSHRKLEGRTSDPEAADYDEAVEIFLQGVRLARIGDLEAGRAQIATAYLLDGRSVLSGFLPKAPTNPNIRELCVDPELLSLLSQSDIGDRHAVTFGGHVIRLLMAGISMFGNHPDHGQIFLAEAISSVNYLIRRIQEEPWLAAPPDKGGVLGGCLTRTNLLYLRSTIYMTMGKRSSAVQDLEKALKIDPTNIKARNARASMWANARLQDERTVFEEYQRLVREVHPDNDGLEVAYAWMAIYVLQDPTLGTLADAKQYYEKCLRASMRKAELYGSRIGSLPVLEKAKKEYGELLRNPASLQKRTQRDVAFARGRMEDLSIAASSQRVPNDASLIDACLSCGKTGLTVGKKLPLCSRCRRVAYCSAECQKADWTKHKDFCKNAVLKTKQFAVDRPEVVQNCKQTPCVPKEPIDDMKWASQQCDRMIKELKLHWGKYGHGLALWWNDLKANQRLDILMRVTNDTLDKSCSYSSSQNAGEIIERWQMLGYCIGFDQNTFLGSCACGNQGQHFFDHKVLHLLYTWTQNTDDTEKMELEFCKVMLDMMIFRTKGGDDCFVTREDCEKLEGVSKLAHDPSMHGDQIQNDGPDEQLHKFSAVTFAIQRKVQILGLLIKLFDEYQEVVRCVPSPNPWERLCGCEFCHQSCELNQLAKKCQSCHVIWWCSKACKKASAHGKKCPNGKRMSTAILFK